MKKFVTIVRRRLPDAVRLCAVRGSSAAGRKRSMLLLAGCMLLSGLFSTARAQDIIVLKDGTLVHSKVCEVTPTEIKYRKLSNPDGPLYTIEKSSVLAINYQNGEKETYAETSAPPSPAPAQAPAPSPSAPREIAVVPADDNYALIAKYNEFVSFEEKPKSGYAKNYSLKYGITKNSVLSNQDLEISIDYIGGGDIFIDMTYPYAINVINKTDRTLYVDLGNTFWVDSDRDSRIYFDASEQTTVSHSSAGGGSIGLGSVAGALGVGGTVGTLAGGIAVGGGTQHGVSTTYANQRILVIPPHGKKYLATNKEVEVKPERLFSSGESVSVSHAESFRSMKGIKVAVKKKGARRFWEEISPYKRDYTITYSTEETFGSYSVVKFGLFVQQIYGDFSAAERYRRKHVIMTCDYLRS